MSLNRRDYIASLALMFGSGISTIIFLLVYLKLVSLVFGNLVNARTVALTVFIAGFAVGSGAGGYLIDRLKRPLFIYGLFQVLVGLFCSGLPLYFSAMTPGYIHAVAPESTSWLWLIFSQVARAGLGIFLPAFLLGASLPLMAHHLIQQPSQTSTRFSRILGSQILGAAVGILGATYWLLPNFGVSRTLYIATAIHLAVGLLAIALQALWNRANAPIPSKTDTISVSGPFLTSLPLSHCWILLITWLSGFFLFSLGVLWSHLLQLTVGGSVYYAGAFLTPGWMGLALGTLLASVMFHHVSDVRRMLIWISSLTALVLALHLLIWHRMPNIFSIAGDPNLDFAIRERARMVTAGIILFPPMLCLGLLFPTLVRLVLRGKHKVGQTVGWMCAVSAFGGVIGLLFAQFFLIPNVGSEWSFYLHVMVYALLPIPLWRSFQNRLSDRQLALRIVLIPVIVAVLLLFSRWNPRSLTSSATLFNSVNSRNDERILYFNESIQGGVTMVVEKEKFLTLLSGGRIIGATGPESALHRQMALVPMMLLPRMETALIIGLGTGHSLESMVIGSTGHIQVAEMVPEIVTLARRYFLSPQRPVLEDQRVTVTNVDGRNFLLLHPETRYDLITVSGNPIGSVGSSSRFSREFYSLCRSRLRSGGILQNQIELHPLRWEDQLTIINTMSVAFPYVAVWIFGNYASVLGSQQPFLWDYEVVKKQAPTFQAEGALANIVTPNLFAIFAHYYLDNTAVRALLRDAILPGQQHDYVSTDFRPIFEYGVARSAGRIDGASTFYRKTAPYSFLPLESILVNVPDNEVPALVRLIEDERIHMTATDSITR